MTFTKTGLAIALAVAVTACGSDGGGGAADATVGADATAGADAPGTPDAMPVGIVFTPITDFTPPEGTATARELVVFESEAQFAAYFGVASPGSIDFSAQWALLYTEGAQPLPGHIATVDTLAGTADGAKMFVDTTHRSPGAGCELLQFTQPSFALVAFDTLAGSVSIIEESNTDTDFSCAALGEGENQTCDAVTLCGSNLICGSLTRSSPGTCYPISFHGVFESEVVSAIPDDDVGGVVSIVSASGLATVDTDVVVYIELEHPAASELTITITNPSSNEVMVWNKEDAPAGPLVIHRAPVGFSGDESVNGNWRLTVTDDTAGNTGSLKRWSVEVVSRLD